MNLRGAAHPAPVAPHERRKVRNVTVQLGLGTAFSQEIIENPNQVIGGNRAFDPNGIIFHTDRGSIILYKFSLRRDQKICALGPSSSRLRMLPLIQELLQAGMSIDIGVIKWSRFL
jgi:hypothetical protein